MSLKSEKIEISGVTYEVKELPVKTLLPLSQRLSENDISAQIELIGHSVSTGGKLLGDGAGELGSSVYMKLIQPVLRVNGLTGGELGNAN
jgi:hypothetical protein